MPNIGWPLPPLTPGFSDASDFASPTHERSHNKRGHNNNGDSISLFFSSCSSSSPRLLRPGPILVGSSNKSQERLLPCSFCLLFLFLLLSDSLPPPAPRGPRFIPFLPRRVSLVLPSRSAVSHRPAFAPGLPSSSRHYSHSSTRPSRRCSLLPFAEIRLVASHSDLEPNLDSDRAISSRFLSHQVLVRDFTYGRVPAVLPQYRRKDREGRDVGGKLEAVRGR